MNLSATFARSTWSAVALAAAGLLSWSTWSVAFDEPRTKLPEGELFSLDVAASESMLAGPDRVLPVYIDSDNRVRGVLWLREARPEGRTITAAGRAVYLVEGDDVVAQGVTEADGYFTLQAPRPGRYRVVGSLEGLDDVARNAGLNRPLARLAKFQVADPPKAAPAPAGADPAAEPKADPKAEPKAADPNAEPKAEPEEAMDDFFKMEDGAFPLGTPPNGNARVFLDVDGTFRFHDDKQSIHHASNDEVFLDKQNIFRGVVTTLDENLKRRPLMRAYLFLLQNGKLVSSSLTTKNGSFRLGPVEPGAYTIIAAYGARTQKGEINGNGNGKNGNGGLAAGKAAQGGVADFASAKAATGRRTRGALNNNYLDTGIVTDHVISPEDPEFRALFQQGAQNLAIQQIAIRQRADAIKLGPVTEFQKRGSAVVAQVKFQQPAAPLLPVLHLSPSPLVGPLQALAGISAAQELAGGAAGGAGAAGAAGGGGGGGVGAGAGGFAIPPGFVPPNNNGPTSP